MVDVWKHRQNIIAKYELAQTDLKDLVNKADPKFVKLVDEVEQRILSATGGDTWGNGHRIRQEAREIVMRCYEVFNE